MSAFGAAAVEQALRDARAELVIDELTSLPKDPSEMAAAAPGDRKLRIEGGGNLHRAARASGVRRYVQQASGFFLEPGGGLADEFAGLAVDASPRVAASVRAYAELEARVLNAGEMEGVVLRYGFFYGPGTWYHPDGASADQVRRQGIPAIGDGAAVWSWIQIEDAAVATAYRAGGAAELLGMKPITLALLRSQLAGSYCSRELSEFLLPCETVRTGSAKCARPPVRRVAPPRVALGALSIP